MALERERKLREERDARQRARVEQLAREHVVTETALARSMAEAEGNWADARSDLADRCDALLSELEGARESRRNLMSELEGEREELARFQQADRARPPALRDVGARLRAGAHVGTRHDFDQRHARTVVVHERAISAVNSTRCSEVGRLAGVFFHVGTLN